MAVPPAPTVQKISGVQGQEPLEPEIHAGIDPIEMGHRQTRVQPKLCSSGAVPISDEIRCEGQSV
ncbi:MAG: hypothetical protein MUF49_32790 [Oculatellaceae cyanobacterium Prado106]|nr:hypothetical protein [Oculatellaceae cyanobacterium Prado106]